MEEDDTIIIISPELYIALLNTGQVTESKNVDGVISTTYDGHVVYIDSRVVGMMVTTKAKLRRENRMKDKWY